MKPTACPGHDNICPTSLLDAAQVFCLLFDAPELELGPKREDKHPPKHRPRQSEQPPLRSTHCRDESGYQRESQCRKRYFDTHIESVWICRIPGKVDVEPESQ